MDKQLSPVQLVTNWVEIKEKIPIVNPGADKWFDAKVSVLLYGIRSLGDLTFEEWSKEIEPTILKLPNVEKLATKDRFCEMPILNLLSSVFAMTAGEQGFKNTDPMAKSQENLAIEILHRLIFILARYSSQDILRLIIKAQDSKDLFDVLDDDRDADWLILGIFDVLNNYSEAVLEIYKKNYVPISALVMKTIALQATFSSCIEKDASSRQNRKAALIKNEPNRKTRAFAEDLYDEKEWKSMKDGAKKIQTQVREYGETVNWHWNDEFQAHDTIYDWIRAHKKNS